MPAVVSVAFMTIVPERAFFAAAISAVTCRLRPCARASKTSTTTCASAGRSSISLASMARWI